ncbi:MAG: acetylglutamate kinase [Bacteroidota bacterium]
MKEKITLVKFGGKLIGKERELSLALAAFAQISGLKVLVHGGGPEATELASRLGIEAPLVEGRRITNEPMLKVAVMSYAGWVNKRLVAQLQALEVQALGLSGADLSVILAHKRPVKTIDYGYAGDIDQVNTDRISFLLNNGIIPVVAPITHDGKGQLLNTNADTIASSLACALAIPFQVHLVYCFELPGVLKDAHDPHSLIPRMNFQEFKQYQEAGIISGGMIPKLDNAFSALDSGVFRVYICQAEAIPYIHSSEYSGTILV